MRNGDLVWYCKRLSKDGDELEVFDKPVAIRLGFQNLTVQPMSGYDNVVEFGEDINKTWNCIAQPYKKWFGVIKEGDRFYVDGAEPEIPNNGAEPDDGWGYDANAKVVSVRPQNVALRFILQKIE